MTTTTRATTTATANNDATVNDNNNNYYYFYYYYYYYFLLLPVHTACAHMGCVCSECIYRIICSCFPKESRKTQKHRKTENPETT